MPRHDQGDGPHYAHDQRSGAMLAGGFCAMVTAGFFALLSTAVARPLPWIFAGAGILVSAGSGAIVGRSGGYRWRDPSGWIAVILDSTWGLPNTALGLLLQWVAAGRYELRPDLSRRQNRLVYATSSGPAIGIGTCVLVMSNVEEPGFSQLLAHETLHTWQCRVAGPIITLTYPAWVLLSVAVGLAVSPLVPQPAILTVMDLAVMDNPWEAMAYWGEVPRLSTRMGGRLSLF